MNGDTNIFACFVSGPSIAYDAGPEEERLADEQGEMFRKYIWGESGIDILLKKIRRDKYGKDLKLILFQFYLNPIPYELQSIDEIEGYRRNEKSIGIPIIVTDDNFYSKPEEERYSFLKQMILQKLNLLGEVVEQKRLDTNMELLKSDLSEVLS